MQTVAAENIVFDVQATAFRWCYTHAVCFCAPCEEEDFILAAVMLGMSGLGHPLIFICVCPGRQLWEMYSFQSTAFKDKAEVKHALLELLVFFLSSLSHTLGISRRTYYRVSFVT